MSCELDLSAHMLNNSSSKHKFSFPKSERFRGLHTSICDSYYEIPTTQTKRSTSFGYGNKTLGIYEDKCIPPIGTYELGTEFKKEPRRGFSFGYGREDMQIGGPLKDAKLLKYVPGPGQYESKSQLENNTITLKSRIPDRSGKHLQKVPGPGTYGFEEIGGRLYYATSKFKNNTNHRIPVTARLAPIRRNRIDVGPATYQTAREDLNPEGRYALSKHENSKARLFDKEPRAQLIYKHMLTTPGPGQYKCFSSFGN